MTDGLIAYAVATVATIALMLWGARFIPEGYQDEKEGFKYGRPPAEDDQ
jgi:hypothetical protein